MFDLVLFVVFGVGLPARKLVSNNWLVSRSWLALAAVVLVLVTVQDDVVGFVVVGLFE